MLESLIDLVTLKAPNYGATVGQAIAGSLGRGNGGRFTRVGSTDPKLQGLIDRSAQRQSLARPKKGGKGKASGKLTSSQQDAAAEKSGLPKDDSVALRDFASGKPLSPEATASLQKRGLVDLGSDGKPRLAPNARGLLSALRRGDQRGIEDALSKAGDSQKREDDKKAKAGSKPAKSASGSGSGSAAKPKPAKAKLPSGLTDTAHYLSDGESLTDAESNSLIRNGLARQTANGLQLTATGLRAVRDSEKPKPRKPAQPVANEGGKQAPADGIRTHKDLTVLKQADGAYRWVVVSSNAFKDLEGEIVSQKALETDAENISVSGDYGPLRWWHVGEVAFKEPLVWDSAHAGAGIDIGDCDFCAMHGRMMVESGTFKSKAIAEAVDAMADQLQVSRGFTHPIGEPVAGVYSNIKGIERSLLPIGKAANPFTSVNVQGVKNDMASLKEKWAGFVNLFGGDESKAKEFAGQIAQKDSDLSKLIAFKEGDIVTEEKAASADAAAAEGEVDENGAPLVGDMTAAEFSDLIGGVLVKALEPLVGAMGKSLNDVAGISTEAKELVGQAQATLTAAKAKDEKEIVALKARLAELEGNAPKGKAFVGSSDPDSVVIPGVVLKTLQQAQAQAANGNNALADFFMSGKAPGAVQGQGAQQ